MAKVIVYAGGKERWRFSNYHAASLPNWRGYDNDTFLFWQGGRTAWYRIDKQRRGWVFAAPAEVPKVYQLLSLLE